MPEHIKPEQVDIWFQDESRIGQQDSLTRVWHEREKGLALFANHDAKVWCGGLWREEKLPLAAHEEAIGCGELFCFEQRSSWQIVQQAGRGQIYAAELLLLDQADIDACMLFRPSETKKQRYEGKRSRLCFTGSHRRRAEIWQRLASADELMHADIQALLAWQPNSDRRYYRCLRLSIRRPFCSGIQAAVRFFALLMCARDPIGLGSVHISSVRKILSAKARLQGEKRSKVGHLASIFNAAGAFLSQKIATR